jgi:Undecaprenyl-phosphate glucose phosphotransferase
MEYMTKNNQKLLNTLNVLSDGLIVLLSYLFSVWIWLDVFKEFSGNMAAIRSWREGMGLAAALYSLAMLLLLALFGLYNRAHFRRFWQEALVILEANALGILAVGSLLFLFRLQDFSRGVLVVFFISNSLLLAAKRSLARVATVRIQDKGFYQKRVLVVGTANLALQYVRNVAAEKQYGYTIYGCLGQKPADMDAKYLGWFDQLENYLQDSDIDEVIVALEPDETSWIKPVISTCEKCGTKVAVIPFYNDIIPSNPSIEIIGDTKLINLRSNPLDNLGYAFIKRSFDLLASFLLIVLFSPLMLIAAVGIRLTSPGPILFRQERVGRNKRLFSMFKFRSMRVNDLQQSGWTTSDDSRKTNFGQFLRKFSIDELPQLLNVLKGDMSLVGPRPEIPFYVEKFKENIPLYMVKHQVRPGMTGWAQVNGYRGDTSIEKRIEFDIWYIENWSIALDAKILFKTLFGGWMNREQLKKNGRTK